MQGMIPRSTDGEEAAMGAHDGKDGDGKDTDYTGTHSDGKGSDDKGSGK